MSQFRPHTAPVRRRKKLLFIVILIFAAVSITLTFKPSTQPSYEGRSLYQWLELYDFTENPAEKRQAETAVLTIGTNAFPTLFEWLDDEPSDWETKIRETIVKTGTPIPDAFMRGAELRSQYARRGFWILREQREHTIPRLIQMMENQNDARAVGRAMGVFAAYGDDGIIAMQKALENTNRSDRVYIINWIDELWRADDSITAAASNAFYSVRQDPDPEVQSAASSALRAIIEGTPDF